MKGSTVKQHFVEFYSPGTFVAEISQRAIPEWDIEKARTMADEITERHNAKPYGFRFITKSRGPDDLDSHVSDKSPFHFINCRVETLEEIKARNDHKDKTLIRNMEGNGYDRVATTTSGWKWTQPVQEGDVVL